MRGKIVGYKRYDFQDKETKRQVTGYTIFITYRKSGFEGEVSKKISLSEKRVNEEGINIYVGAPLCVEFNDEGRVEAVYNE